MTLRARLVCLVAACAVFQSGSVVLAGPNTCQTASRDVQDAVARYRAAVHDVAAVCGKQEGPACAAARAAADVALDEVGVAHAAMISACIVTPPPPPPPPPPGTERGRLVINEVDYDQPGTDGAEFVEIYNPGTETVSLDGVAVVFINGADNTEYLRVNLNGALNPGAYAVIAAPGVAVQSGALVFPVALTIQNGSPDGIAIVDTLSGAVLDALSYEGSITNAVIPGIGTVSLVEGEALSISVADSNTVPAALARIPNGQDTDNAANDWILTFTPTPGGPNN